MSILHFIGIPGSRCVFATRWIFQTRDRINDTEMRLPQFETIHPRNQTGMGGLVFLQWRRLHQVIHLSKLQATVSAP